MNDEEYEKVQEARINDDFIVDDEFGYKDKGGEIWEYDEDEELNRNKNKHKKRKLDVSPFSSSL